jgi:DNA-binding response OmpR family regulator/two-component sensor histidine kinase
MIKENTLSLLNLVNQILDLRKLESNSLELNLVQSDIISYIRYLTESHSSLASHHGIEISFHSHIDELVMDHDREKVVRIISNLLSNAVKFNRAGGTVRVELDQVEKAGIQQLQILIQDSGVGIPPRQLKHIFNRFYQADNLTDIKRKGSGIGLSLTKRLVELMDGDIAVTSKEHHGTTFSILLPVRNRAKVADEKKPGWDDRYDAPVFSKSMVPDTTSDHKHRDGLAHLLIIEDNPTIMELLAAQLAERYNIAKAFDGKQGIESALERVPDLIVCDVMMPEKDGYEVCETLKSDIKTSHIPIILLTAKADHASKLHGLKYGADAYMAKPFDPLELQLRLKNLLELRRATQAVYKHLDESSKETPFPQEDAFVLKVREVVMTHLEDNAFNIAQLCKVIGMSRSQLHNKLKALTGLSASNYIRSVRLQQARNLLQNPKLNISEIAYAVGFNSPTYFSSSYQQEFGESPSETRGRG